MPLLSTLILFLLYYNPLRRLPHLSIAFYPYLHCPDQSLAVYRNLHCPDQSLSLSPRLHRPDQLLSPSTLPIALFINPRRPSPLRSLSTRHVVVLISRSQNGYREDVENRGKPEILPSILQDLLEQHDGGGHEE